MVNKNLEKIEWNELRFNNQMSDNQMSDWVIWRFYLLKWDIEYKIGEGVILNSMMFFVRKQKMNVEYMYVEM